MTEQGLAAAQRADAWMHEHDAAVELEVDAAIGEGRLSPHLIGRAREEGYVTESP